MCSSHSKDLKEIERRGFCLIETLIECFETAMTVRSILTAMMRVLAD